MESEKKPIKILKIKDGKGYYLDKNGNYVEVDKVDRNSLLYLINLVINSEVEIETYYESLILNKVHQIIYKEISQKILTLKASKLTLLSNIDSEYADLINKYKD